MSTPFTTTSRPAAVPATKEFTAAWIAYFLFAISTVLLWPAVISLIICYSKRGHAETGFIDSHHRWMIRSFWYSQLAFLIFFVLVGVWPIIADVVRQVISSGDWESNPSFRINVDWVAIFSSLGAAMMGGVGIAATFVWYLYRMLRGMIALADARPLP
jgi:uncharacterized membrane protein